MYWVTSTGMMSSCDQCMDEFTVSCYYSLDIEHNCYKAHREMHRHGRTGWFREKSNFMKKKMKNVLNSWRAEIRQMRWFSVLLGCIDK